MKSIFQIIFSLIIVSRVYCKCSWDKSKFMGVCNNNKAIIDSLTTCCDKREKCYHQDITINCDKDYCSCIKYTVSLCLEALNKIRTCTSTFKTL
uniref:Uncharacterized protein n=1 Tax=Meloidogyne incognita TaxID=6306 RepID=A0A914L1M5_MELIC